MQTHSRRAVLAGLAALLVSPRSGATQDHTLRIVYPFSAGGAADSVARLIAEHLQNSLGRAVIVENIVGAGGRIGARTVKNGPPNGTVLLFASFSQMTLQPHIYRDLGYDPFDDFLPISQTVEAEIAFAVSRETPAHSIKEVNAWLKANPAQALYGSPGIGTGPHFAGIEFGRLSGLALRHVPYRGTPPRFQMSWRDGFPCTSPSLPNSSSNTRVVAYASWQRRVQRGRHSCLMSQLLRRAEWISTRLDGLRFTPLRARPGTSLSA